jgi:hypothetical protein
MMYHSRRYSEGFYLDWEEKVELEREERNMDRDGHTHMQHMHIPLHIHGPRR